MMDIQSPSCFRSNPALPRTSSTGSLGVTSPGDRADPASYTPFSRSNSYSGNMVVESQPLNYHPMTPDPHPDNADSTQSLKVDLSTSSQKSTLPPEGALTPTEESMAKRKLDEYETDISKDTDFDNKQTKENISDINGFNDFSESNDSIDLAQFGPKRRRLSESVAIKNAESFLENAYKVALDKSPPMLSPKTMSDTDFDGASTGSPSVSGERRRRKPNIEDIVRRMREVETDYESDESDHEVFDEEEEGDEVDGDMCGPRLPHLPPTLNSLQHIKGEINENNNIIDKIRTNDTDKENAAGENGIPLPPTSSLEPGSGESVIKQVGHVTPTHSSSNWMGGGPFNSFPMFPFQGSPGDMSFSKFGSPYESKFTTPELEKDYLKCQYCERTFRRQKNLENHIENTHHGKSPQRKKTGDTGDMYFKCTHCPYTTKHQSNLYVHLRIHTGTYIRLQ